MQHDQHRHARAGDAPGPVEQAELVAEVEARDRLVEEQRLRLGHAAARLELAEHARELHALLLAARQALVAASGEIEHAGGREAVGDDGRRALALFSARPTPSTPSRATS